MVIAREIAASNAFWRAIRVIEEELGGQMILLAFVDQEDDVAIFGAPSMPEDISRDLLTLLTEARTLSTARF